MHSWNCPDDYEARRQARWDAERDSNSGWGRSYSSPYDCDHAEQEYRRAYEREYEEREMAKAEERRQERAREERRQQEAWEYQQYVEAAQRAEEEAYYREQEEAYWAAQGIAAGTDETPQAVRPAGQKPDPKDAP